MCYPPFEQLGPGPNLPSQKWCANAPPIVTGPPGAYMVSRMVRNSWGLLACVASISNRVIARKLEREQKKWKGGGEGRRGNACPQTPRFRKTPLDISRFGSFVYWQLIKIEAFFLLSSQLSQRTHAETLATQARGLFRQACRCVYAG